MAQIEIEAKSLLVRVYHKLNHTPSFCDKTFSHLTQTPKAELHLVLPTATSIHLLLPHNRFQAHPQRRFIRRDINLTLIPVAHALSQLQIKTPQQPS